MIRLGQLAKRDKNKAALCYFQLGNAWYNMSYYGKNWLMVRQWWSRGDFYEDAGFRQSRFHDDYFGTATARSYYLKAAEMATDKNLAALAHFMVSHCDAHSRKYKWCLQNKNQSWNYEEPAVVQPPRSKHVDMNVFNRIVSECETYQSFIKQYNKKV